MPSTRANVTATVGGNSFFAGKNRIINGDFSIWQRGTSFSTGNGAYVYTADRWVTYFYGNNTTTVSQQTFTPGTAPVAGYESQYFLRVNSTNTQTFIGQRIEDVRTFAGQTVTVSFWAKAASGTPTFGINYAQLFGSGGSSTVVTSGTNQTLSTSWARYSTTISVPSVSGKTIGAGSNVEIGLFTTSININIDIWGVQVEAGSVATPFETATGTLQGELAACQRYYYLHASGDQISIGLGTYTLSNELHTHVQFPVAMRTAPTLDQATGTNYYRCFRNGAADDFDSFIISRTNTTNTFLYQTGATISGTAGDAGIIHTYNASAKLAFTAEL